MLNNPSPSLTIAEAIRGAGLMRRLVLRELAPLRHGRLLIQFPEGGTLRHQCYLLRRLPRFFIWCLSLLSDLRQLNQLYKHSLNNHVIMAVMHTQNGSAF